MEIVESSGIVDHRLATDSICTFAPTTSTTILSYCMCSYFLWPDVQADRVGLKYCMEIVER